MRPLSKLALACAAAVSLHASQAPQAPPVGQAPAAPAPPTILLAPGLREVPDYRNVNADPPPPSIPAGFTSIFNGKDLSGWHISKTARHGVNPDYHVAHGMILGTQRPLGSGGLLVTDKKYRNFELSMEVKPDWGNDSGVFIRTTETGLAYQITMDYLPGGSMGRFISEGGFQFGAGRGAAPAAAAAPGARAASPDRSRGLQRPGHEGMEARGLEHRADPRRGRRPSRDGMDQRPAGQRRH